VIRAGWVWLALGGCSGPPGPSRATYTDPIIPQACIYDLQMPVELSGSIPTYVDPGVDCIGPEGGETFTMGFGWPGGVLHVAARRPVAGVVQLHDVGLYVRTETGWCIDWDGTAVIEELPAWAVFIDGTCVGGGVRMIGNLSGR
jgi:hypothetical protein